MPNSRADVELDPEAEQELVAAFRWYAKRSPNAAQRFLSAIEYTLRRIQETPKAFPRMEGTQLDLRRVVIQSFPYIVLYLPEPSGPLVVAIAHAKRRPGYWRQRLR